MQGKSNSFLQITPFQPKSGLLASSYVAFPIDNLGRPVPDPFGCIQVTDLVDLIASTGNGTSPVPNSISYQITNVGGGQVDWSAAVSENWVEIDTPSGTLNPGQSATVTVTISDEANCLSPGAVYTSVTSFVNETNGCGSIDLGVNLTYYDPAIDFFCRTRGGTASLCGFSELTSPSTPPKKYLVQSYDGHMHADTYALNTCAPPVIDTTDDTISGQFSYSSIDCSTTNTGNLHHVTSQGVNENVPFGPGIIGPNCGMTYSLTQTQETRDGDTTTCCPSGGGGGHYTGNTTITLSAEDTELNAITRLLVANDWTEWTEESTCTASYEERTAFTFDYVEAQFRVDISGLAPSLPFSILVDIYRRSFGIDPYILFDTIQIDGTADVSGNAQVTQDVPNEIGFDTYATNPRILNNCPEDPEEE